MQFQDPSRSPLHIKKENKFFARLLSKEISLSSPSFRVYGSTKGSVPFLWESEPGTPKVADSGTSIPPITPPPSYQFRHNSKKKKDDKKKKITILSVIASFLRRIGFRKDGTRSSKITYSPL